MYHQQSMDFDYQNVFLFVLRNLDHVLDINQQLWNHHWNRHRTVINDEKIFDVVVLFVDIVVEYEFCKLLELYVFLVAKEDTKK
jgi:hypothetical protein